MSRRLLILANANVRARAIDWVRGAPDNSRVEFKEPKRTLDQSAKMWVMLTDVSEQVTHCGRQYDPESWKVLFLHALGREVSFLPSLDEKTFIPIGQSSSDLSVAEMRDLIELIYSFGAERSVVFQEPVARYAR